MTETTPPNAAELLPAGPENIVDLLRVLVAGHSWHEETQLLAAFRVLDTDGAKLLALIGGTATPGPDLAAEAFMQQLADDVARLVAAGVDPDDIPAPVTPLPGQVPVPVDVAPVEPLPVTPPPGSFIPDPTVPPEPVAVVEPPAPVAELPTSEPVPAGTVTPPAEPEQPVAPAEPEQLQPVAPADAAAPADGAPFDPAAS